MNWIETAQGQGIDGIYLEARLDKINCLSPALIDFGKKWIADNERPSLFITGGTGSGKTYFMIALIHEIFDKKPNLWFRFKRCVDLFDESLEILRESKNTTEFLRKFAECEILSLDDVGVESLTERTKRDYFSIIDYRLNRNLPFVFTSNLTREEFCRSYGDRIASRMAMCLEIEFPRKDLRKEKEFITNQKQMAKISIPGAIQLDFGVKGIPTQRSAN